MNPPPARPAACRSRSVPRLLTVAVLAAVAAGPASAGSTFDAVVGRNYYVGEPAASVVLETRDAGLSDAARLVASVEEPGGGGPAVRGAGAGRGDGAVGADRGLAGGGVRREPGGPRRRGGGVGGPGPDREAAAAGGGRAGRADRPGPPHAAAGQRAVVPAGRVRGLPGTPAGGRRRRVQPHDAVEGGHHRRPVRPRPAGGSPPQPPRGAGLPRPGPRRRAAGAGGPGEAGGGADVPEVPRPGVGGEIPRGEPGESRRRWCGWPATTRRSSATTPTTSRTISTPIRRTTPGTC